MRPERRYSFMPISDLMGYGHPSATLLHNRNFSIEEKDFSLFIDGISYVISKWSQQVSQVTNGDARSIAEENMMPFRVIDDIYHELLNEDSELVFKLRKDALTWLSKCKSVLDKLEMSYKRPQMLKDFYISIGERLKTAVLSLMGDNTCL